MASKEYLELLRDPRWQRKRLESLQAAEWKCSSCLRLDKTLNVHHVAYRTGAKPWEYEQSELKVLCEDCHKTIHSSAEQIKFAISRLSESQILAALGYVQGMLSARDKSTRVRVVDFNHARGIADAIGGTWRIGSFDENGGPEFVTSEAEKSNGTVAPAELYEKLWEWFVERGNEFESSEEGKRWRASLR